MVWDPARTVVVRGSQLQTRAKMSLLEGRELTGWPQLTISRGEVIYDSGRIVAQAGRGRLATTKTGAGPGRI